jgi:hypothetical protein
MEFPGLGSMARDDEFGDYRSAPVPVPMLGGHRCRIVLGDYDDDPNPQDFHAAVSSFLSADRRVLQEAAPHVYRYYLDCISVWKPGDDEYVGIPDPASVWAHVQFGDEAFVSRRLDGDQRVYVSLESECDWEPEHGLHIVFKDGMRVNKVGDYDGHVSNADAYGDPRLEDVVYRSFRD